MKIEKYRVFDKKRGAWLHPTEFKLNGYGICWTLLDVDFRDLVLVLCTGLHDKNGKEIYESDIVRNKWTCSDGTSIGSTWVVKYGQYDLVIDEYSSCGHVGFYLENTKKEADYHDQVESLNGLCFDKDEGIEVIGNIYENPELLNP